MEDCLFCKIIKGEIPSYKIYEDENVYAFLDIAGDYLGHTLVLPKKHFRNILDIDTESLISVTLAIQKIAKHYKDNCGFDGVSIFNLNESAGEQSIFHLHFHIVPRKNNDGYEMFGCSEKHNFDLRQIQKNLKIN